MHRFFVTPQWSDSDRVVIGGRQVHQIRDVLRMKPGDRIAILDNTGWKYEVEIRNLSREHVEGTIHSRRQIDEPIINITLYQALLKSDRFEFVLQKCTEIGVSKFVPVVYQRCTARQPSAAKVDRWQNIIRESAEQSGRGRLPKLDPAMNFEQACRSSARPALLAFQGGNARGLRQLWQHGAPSGDSISIFIGPEGGFSESEVELACQCGLTPVTLGRRVLRAETAGLVAITLVLYECGDLTGE